MLTEDVNYDYFEYVVNKVEPSRVCFGSGKHRLTIFDEIKVRDMEMYDIIEPEKIRSKRGMPGLANQEKRLPSNLNLFSPGPARYYPGSDKGRPKQCCAPFNTSALQPSYIKNLPGPQTYNPHKVKLCKRTRFDYNFGNPCLLPYVEMICLNYPKDICVKCEQPFEFGDHWHYKHTIYLCNFCMIEEHKLHEVFNRDKLLQFKKIRTCAFKHRHEGTSAKVRIMSERHIKKKILLENYLSLYSQCFGTKSRTELVRPLNEQL